MSGALFEQKLNIYEYNVSSIYQYNQFFTASAVNPTAFRKAKFVYNINSIYSCISSSHHVLFNNHLLGNWAEMLVYFGYKTGNYPSEMDFISKCKITAGLPKAALLFGFFGGFRCGVWLFIVLLVRYENRK